MKFNISKLNIDLLPENEVTSPYIFTPHRRKTLENLHTQGIFSPTIFGQLDHCACATQQTPGWCPRCHMRVVSFATMPDLWINLLCDVPVLWCSYATSGIDAELCKQILTYQGGVNDRGKYVPYDHIKSNHYFVGIAALKQLGVSETWLDLNTTDFVSVPYPTYRPLITLNNGRLFVSEINKAYVNLLKKLQFIYEWTNEADNVKTLLTSFKVIVAYYQQIMSCLLKKICYDNYSIIKSEIISHPISLAARAVFSNRTDLNEDVLLVGDTLIPTLFPYYYKIYNGNMIKINQKLIDEDIKILLNRPPTIGHMSIMALKPRIASLYPYNHIGVEAENGLKANTSYISLYHHRMSNMRSFAHQELLGDIEHYCGFSDSELVDINNSIRECNNQHKSLTIPCFTDQFGVRTIAANPIIDDGLSGDHDGDVLLTIPLFSLEANKQAELMLPSKSYLDYRNGSIRNSIIPDFEYTATENIIKKYV